MWHIGHIGQEIIPVQSLFEILEFETLKYQILDMCHNASSLRLCKMTIFISASNF